MKRIELQGRWKLIRVKNGDSYEAPVPGDTMSALIDAGVVSDPYYGDNELAAQWVGREDWRYERSFEVDPRLLADQATHEGMFLHFDSLDTCAEVRLNGKLIGSSDNMFVRRRFKAGKILRAGTNTLTVLLRSPETEALRRAAKSPYPYPHSVYPIQSPHRNLLRKVQCHAGWDWGPCLMVSGIYGEVYIDSAAEASVDYIRVRQRHDRGDSWRLDVECDLYGNPPGDSTVEAKLYAPGWDGRTAAAPVAEARAAGVDSTRLSLRVDRVKLWWPSEQGEQPLYTLVVSNGKRAIRKRIGFRELEVIVKDDRRGRSMTFRVNGRDIFCKGANWIPVDALPQRQSDRTYRHLLESAKEAHMNMIRVWGGGQYEADSFYDLCDELGLLVWHDFMFACGTYPADHQFLAGVAEEVGHQVKRLQTHPSIALWCGNNENLGALNWFDVTKQNRDRYVVDYDRLYEGTIGEVVEKLDPDRTFWPSSPSGGRADYSDNWHDDTKGDMHYWSVWHEGKSFDAYYAVTPRFCSEFGFQSFPSMSTVEGFTPSDQLNLTSPILEHHQRNRRGNTIIIESLSRYFRFPEGLEQMLYLSQVQQAFAIKTAVEYWRSQRPVCMGSLFWQLNDNWPVASWASIEHSGKWKLLHYEAKRFFEPVHILAFIKGERLEAWICNDSPAAVAGEWRMQFFDFCGKLVREEAKSARVGPGAATRIFEGEVEKLEVDPRDCFLHLSFAAADSRSTNDLFLTYPKSCNLEIPKVKLLIDSSSEGAFVTLESEKPAFHVTLDPGTASGRFDDNGFTLLPGAPRRVRFHGRSTAAQLKRSLQLYELRGSYR